MSKAKIGYTATFDPLPWQLDPWRDKGHVLLLTGSAGGGKSRIAAEKVHGYCLKYPGSTWLMLRKAREWCGKSIVPFFQRSVVGDAGDPRLNKSDGVFQYANGSTIYTGGMLDDRQREAVRSIGGAGGIDGAWLEEATAFTEDDYNEVLARLRGTSASWRQLILTTNPDSPQHWIYRRLILGGEAKVYYSAAGDNPYNPAEYVATLASMSGVLGDRMARGRWVIAEGAVYETWNESVHVIDPFPIPDSWRRIRAIDFGFTNPFVCQWWALDNDDKMYLYRELYGAQRIVEDWAADIKRLSEGERIEVTVCDHDAEDRATLERHGVRVQPASKEITPGLQRVTARLRDARIFIMRNALTDMDTGLDSRKLPFSTAQEFSGYTWPKSSDGRTVKEVPVKVNDHGMDALRYAVMYVDKGKPPPNQPGKGDPFIGITQPKPPAKELIAAPGGGVRFGYRPKATADVTLGFGSNSNAN